MYPFSRKYFSARERGAARKDSILSNIFSSPPFFSPRFPKEYSRFVFTIPLRITNRTPLLLSIRSNSGRREKEGERERGGKIIRVRETVGCLKRFEMRRWIGQTRAAGSCSKLSQGRRGSDRRHTPNLLLVYRNSIRRDFWSSAEFWKR